MAMQKIKVADLKPGDRFNKAVYIDADNLLTEAGVPIRQSDLDRLLKWNITEVETAGNRMEQPEPAESPAGPLARAIADKEKSSGVGREYTRILAQKEGFKDIVRNLTEKVRTSYEAVYQSQNSLKPFDINPLREQITLVIEAVSETRNLVTGLAGWEPAGGYLFAHSAMATIYALMLGAELEYSRPRMIDLGLATALADVGMLAIPQNIRDKTSALTGDELAAVRKHPLVAYKLITQVAKLKTSLAMVALQHHENFDGTGYPRGLKDKQIDEAARIAAIADRYSALIRARPAREQSLSYQALNSFLSVDLGKFDPLLLRRFVDIVSMYPLGSLVMLSSNEIGIVVRANPGKPIRPVIKIIRDTRGQKVAGAHQFIDLVEAGNRYIVKAMSPQSLGISLQNELVG